MLIPKIPTNLEETRITRILLCLIIIIGAGVRLWYYNSILSDPLMTLITASDVMDQYRFHNLAVQFTKGNWLGYSTHFSPVYSYIIALIYTFSQMNITNVFVVQMIISTACLYIYYKTPLHLFENVKVGLLAALIAALYAPLIFFDANLVRASFVTNFNLLGFYFLLLAIKNTKPKFYLTAGLMMGCASVLRFNLLPFVSIFYLLFIYKERWKIKLIGVFAILLSMLVCYIPLALRNHHFNQKALITQQGPSTFWIGNTPDSSGIGLPRTPLRKQFAEESNGKISKTLQIFVREIRNQPTTYLSLYGRKIYSFLNAYEIPSNLSFDQYHENHTPLQWAFFNFGIIIPFALLGIFCGFRKHKYIELLYLFLGILFISSILYHIQGRYRIPSIPFFILFASYGIYLVFFALRKQQYLFTVSSFVLLISFTLFTSPNYLMIKKHFGGYIRAGDYFNRMVSFYILHSQKNHLWNEHKNKTVLTKALNENTNILNTVPESNTDFRSTTYVIRGLIFKEMNQPQEALSSFNKATDLSGDRSERIKQIMNSEEDFFEDISKNISFDNFNYK